jgi:hypothetical protein
MVVDTMQPQALAIVILCPAISSLFVVIPASDYYRINVKVFSLTTAGLAILTDVLILLIPIAMLWDLRLNIRKKIAVGVALSLGWIVTIIGIVRFKIFYDYWFQLSEDDTYGLDQTVSGIEINVAIITCCGPTFKAMMAIVAPKVFGSSGVGASRSGTPYFSSRGYAMQNRASSRPMLKSWRERLGQTTGRRC